ncbi:unnamed protein product, partial [Meganyctiphanes norvegica]
MPPWILPGLPLLLITLYRRGAFILFKTVKPVLSHKSSTPGKMRAKRFYFVLKSILRGQECRKKSYGLLYQVIEAMCPFWARAVWRSGGPPYEGSNKLFYTNYYVIYHRFIGACVHPNNVQRVIFGNFLASLRSLGGIFNSRWVGDVYVHIVKVHYILNELVMGGMVLETNMTEIITRIDEQNKLEKQEAGLAAAPARAVSAVKNMNLPQQIKDMKLPDLPAAIKDLKF